MKYSNAFGYYPAPMYHDAPNHFGQFPAHMVLLAIQHNLMDPNHSMVGRMQLTVFPSMEMEEAVACPLPGAVVKETPCLPSYALLPRGSELKARELSLTSGLDPYLRSGPQPSLVPAMRQYHRPENSQHDSNTRQFDVTDALPAKQFFAGPGLLRILRFGDFRTQLEPQLRYPKRIQESHQLPCYVQVFEVAKPRSAEEIISLLGSPALEYQFAILDAPAVGKLRLSELPQSNRGHLRRAPGLLVPGDRVFRLQVVRDPTVTSTQGVSNSHAVSAGTETGIPAQATSKPLKSNIPENYLSPWEFEKTREEALQELSSETGWLRNLWRAARAWRKSHELRNWRLLLIGNSADDQLWGVPPPKWALSDRAVRRWARRTLALAGYDSDVMFPEWEIFWRRKGF